MVEDFVGKLRAGEFDAPLVAGRCPARGVNLFLQFAVELLRGEGRSLPGHCFQHAAGVAGRDRLAQFVRVLAAFELHAAVFALKL